MKIIFNKTDSTQPITASQQIGIGGNMIRKLSITSPQAGTGSVRRFFRNSLKFPDSQGERTEKGGAAEAQPNRIPSE